MDKSWFVIVNPTAGSGRGERDWPEIMALFRKHGIKFEFAFTQRKHHAVELAVLAIRRGNRQIICVGGDGTLNEVVNGIFIQRVVPTTDVTIAVVALGTGNDWARTFTVIGDYEQNVKYIRDGKTFLQDVGKVDYFEARIKHSRYFANAAGIGFDAEVALTTNALKEEGEQGRFLYLLSILKTLVAYRPSVAKVQIDSHSYGGVVFSATLGIGKYNGGGMMQVPNATPNDGMLEVTLIQKVSRFSVLRNIFRLYNGNILKHPKILGYQARQMRVTSKPPFNLEVDGESLGTSPFVFSIVPQGIRVVVGADFKLIGGPQTAIYSEG